MSSKEDIFYKEFECHEPLLVKKFEKTEKKLSKTIDKFKRLKHIYNYIDNEWNKIVYPLSSCNVGCPHCCKMEIQLTELEAEYITKNVTGLAITESAPPPYLYASLPQSCPFLNESGRCSIYELRPFSCRTYFSLDDPDYCRLERQQKTITIGHSSHDILIKCVDIIRDMNNGRPAVSIHSFFPHKFMSY